MDLTLVSYNIRKAVGADLRRRPDRILDVLAECHADVVLLQEADRRFGDRRTALSPSALDDRGWRVAPLGGRPAAIGWHGNAMLLSGRAELVRAEQVALPCLEPRGAILAEVRVAGAPLRIVGAHLDLSGLWRARQVRALAAMLQSLPHDLPTLVAGDFNEWRLAPGWSRRMNGLRPVPLGPSFPARLPVARFDRVFASPDIEVLAAEVHRSALASIASDHLPVRLRMRLPAPAAACAAFAEA